MVGKMRWGDSAELDDDGDFDMSAALPASQVSAASDHEPPRTSLFAARRGEAQTLTAHRTFPQPRQVIGPDANGVKTYIDYKVKDDGLKVRDRTSLNPARPQHGTSAEILSRFDPFYDLRTLQLSGSAFGSGRAVSKGWVRFSGSVRIGSDPRVGGADQPVL